VLTNVSERKGLTQRAIGGGGDAAGGGNGPSALRYGRVVSYVGVKGSPT